MGTSNKTQVTPPDPSFIVSSSPPALLSPNGERLKRFKNGYLLFDPFFFEGRYPIVSVVHQAQGFLARMLRTLLFEFVEELGVLVIDDGVYTLLGAQITLSKALVEYLVVILYKLVDLLTVPSKGTSLYVDINQKN